MRIPEVTRRRLASSVVGTPGVNPAGAELAGAFGSLGSVLADVGSDTATVANKQLAAINEAKGKVDGNKAIMQYNSALLKLRKTAKSQEDYDKQSQDLFDQFSGSLQGSPTAQALFGAEGRRKQTSHAEKYFNDTVAGKVAGVAGTVNETANGLAQDLYSVYADPTKGLEEKSGDLAEIMITMSDTIQGAKGAVSDKQLNELEAETMEAMARAATNGLIDAGKYEDAKEFIKDMRNSPMRDVLSEEQFQDIEENARKQAAASERDLKRAQDKHQFDTATNMFEALVSGKTISEQEIETAVLKRDLKEKDAEAIRKYKQSTVRREFLGDNPATDAELQDLLARIPFKERDPKKDAFKPVEIEDEELVFERIVQFRQRVMESAAEGKITRTTANAYLKKVTPTLNKKLDKIVEGLNSYVEAKGWFVDDIAQHVSDPADIDRLNGAFGKLLLRKIDEREAKERRPLDLNEVKNLVDATKKSFVLELNPDRGKFIKGNIYNLPEGVFRVLGFKSNGSPLLSHDLSARVFDEPGEDK